MSRESKFYTATRFLARAYFEIMHRVEHYGLENFPPAGPFILASNHCSYYDPPLLAYPLPRPLYIFSRRTLMRFRSTGWIFLALNCIPVDRDTADFGALKKVFKILKEDQGLLMFPEGTRTRDDRLGEAKSGVGMVACRAQVPVVPARIFGAYEAWPRQAPLPRTLHQITVVYGSPLAPTHYDPGPGHPDRYGEASRRIMQAISALALPPPLRL